MLLKVLLVPGNGSPIVNLRVRVNLRLSCLLVVLRLPRVMMFLSTTPCWNWLTGLPQSPYLLILLREWHPRGLATKRLLCWQAPYLRTEGLLLWWVWLTSPVEVLCMDLMLPLLMAILGTLHFRVCLDRQLMPPTLLKWAADVYVPPLYMQTIGSP